MESQKRTVWCWNEQKKENFTFVSIFCTGNLVVNVEIWKRLFFLFSFPLDRSGITTYFRDPVGEYFVLNKLLFKNISKLNYLGHVVKCSKNIYIFNFLSSFFLFIYSDKIFLFRLFLLWKHCQFQNGSLSIFQKADSPPFLWDAR